MATVLRENPSLFRVQRYNPKTGYKENIRDFGRLTNAIEFVKKTFSWRLHEHVGDEHYFYLTKYGDDEIDIFRVQ